MKKTLVLIAILAAGLPVFSQTYLLTVQDGYAETMQASPGDTIHIWATEWGVASTFSHWSGDVDVLERPNEWHTRVVMPAHDVTLAANAKALPTGATNPFKFEMMQGYLIQKPVYSYFPTVGAPKMVVWLWHGTGGSAKHWIWRDLEMRLFCNYLIANDIAVIVTESDESTMGTDLNGDGALRYDYLGDTLTGRDFANVRAIRDTFIHRGKITWNTPMSALGFSAGGAFSVLLAGRFGWQAGISHNSPGGIPLSPTMYSMSLRDGHPEVGAAGNLEAMQKVDTLKSLGRCAEFFLLRPSPLYPQRFKRIPGITTAKSNALSNELNNNGCLNAKGFLTKSPGQIEFEITQDPQNWPNLLAYNDTIRDWIKDELAVMWSSHHYHTDFMAADLAFLLDPCGQSSFTQTPENEAVARIFPNPALKEIFLPETACRARIFNFSGRLVSEKMLADEKRMDVSALPVGAYWLEILTENGARQAERFVKI